MLLAIISLLQLSLAQIYAPFDVDSDNNYYISIALGTPPQDVLVALDFGTADLVLVPDRCSNGAYNVPCSGGNLSYMFNVNITESLQLNLTAFTATSVLEGSVSGFWGYDVLQLGGATFNNSVFGIRSDVINSTFHTSQLNTGEIVRSKLGLGPRSQQNTVMWSDNGSFGPTYDSLLYRIDGASPSFSIWVDPISKQNGVVIFGGIDEQFYDPSTFMTTELAFSMANPAEDFQFNPNQLQVLSFISNNILLNDVVGGQEEYTQMPFSNATINTNLDWEMYFTNIVLVSDGSFGMSQYALGQITNTLYGGSMVDQSTGKFLVGCSTQAHLAIEVNDNYFLTINLSDYVLPANATGVPQYDSNGSKMCILDIDVLSASGIIVLPNSILMDYFIAVDYSQNIIGFAQPKEVSENIETASITSIQESVITFATSSEFIGTPITLGFTEGRITTTAT